MAPTVADRKGGPRPGPDPESWTREMQTTFDAEELTEFFDAFVPLRFPLPEGEPVDESDLLPTG